MNTTQNGNNTSGGHPGSADSDREAGDRTQQQEEPTEQDADGIEKTLDQPAEQNIHPFERYQ